MLTSHAHHVRIGVTRGRVRPSSIVIAPGKPEGEASGTPLAAATGILGAVAVGAAFWGAVALLFF